MTFKDGDFVEIDYSLWGAPDNKLLATTDEQRAKSEGIYDKNLHYGAELVILGSNSVIKGLDNALRSMGVNEQKKFTFKPEEAFGNRNEELVRVMPVSEFRKHDINPYVGMQVSVDNIQVIVKSVNSGRVIVDANHPYAGREVTYEVKVVKAPTSDKEKIEALGKTYRVSPTRIDINEKSASIYFDNNMKKDADYFLGKASLVAAVFTYIKGIESVKVDEEYIRPKENAPESKA